MTLSEASATITIDKGDILGVCLVAVPAFFGVMFLFTIVLAVLMGGTQEGLKSCVPIIPICGVLSLVGWGLWEFAHWFAGA